MRRERQERQGMRISLTSRENRHYADGRRKKYKYEYLRAGSDNLSSISLCYFLSYTRKNRFVFMSSRVLPRFVKAMCNTSQCVNKSGINLFNCTFVDKTTVTENRKE